MISRYVNTNEDVGDFRVQLSNRSGTLLVKDIGYANRYHHHHQYHHHDYHHHYHNYCNNMRTLLVKDIGYANRYHNDSLSLS